MGRTEAIIALVDELLVAGAVALLLVLLAWGTGVFPREAALAATVVIVAFMAAVGYKAAQAQLRAPEAGPEALVGKTAAVVEDIPPQGEGMVLLEGEYWRARSTRGPVARGEKVRIVGVEGLTLLVEPPAKHTGDSKA